MPQRFNTITLALIALILFAFAIGAYQVNAQAAQINKIIDQQSPLIFGFENVGPNGQITFLVTCTRLEDDPKYVCTSKQQDSVAKPATVTPTPAR